MKEILFKAYQFNLKYAYQLVLDLNDLQMSTCLGNGLENHPAWTFGHLVNAAALTSKYLKGPYEMPDGWEELFRRSGPGDPRTPEKEPEKYPPKRALLSELTRQHELVIQLITPLKPGELNKEVPWRFNKYMPKLGDLLYFMCITHESMHLSQVAAWRRGMNLESALGKM